MTPRESLKEKMAKVLTEAQLGVIMAEVDQYVEQAVGKAQMMHLSDLSRAVGILQGLGYPDNYLEQRRTEMLASLTKPKNKGKGDGDVQAPEKRAATIALLAA